MNYYFTKYFTDYKVKMNQRGCSDLESRLGVNFPDL